MRQDIDAEVDRRAPLPGAARDPVVAHFVGDVRATRPRLPLDFVENKLPDHERVAALLAASAERNQWTNFGPLSRALEATLEALVAPPGSRVVACSSGTTALNALVGLTEFEAGRPLRWVTSAFGFLSCFIGPLVGAHAIDCAADGRLDLERLAGTPEDAYDAVLLTNPFGLYADWSDHIDFCAQRGKRVVLDYAAGFPRDGRAASLAGVPFLMSFHQTKAWGAGEGGAMVVPAARADDARALLNFAATLPDRARRHASNGKLSDLAAAYILDRLERFPDWAPGYETQKRRVVSLVARAGLPLTPLGPVDSCGPLGHVPFLADFPVPHEALDNGTLVLRKYYRPGADGFPVARGLFERMVNVPCHRELASLSDPDIVSALERVVEAAARSRTAAPALTAAF